MNLLAISSFQYTTTINYTIARVISLHKIIRLSESFQFTTTQNVGDKWPEMAQNHV